MKTLVCILFSEALPSPEVAWSLVDAGFRVVVIARKGYRSALHYSSRVVVKEIAPPEINYMKALAELEEHLHSLETGSDEERVIFPIDDTAVWLCSRKAPNSKWILAGPRGSAADLAINKWVQVQKAREAGLRVPTTQIAYTNEEVFQISHRLPLVLKPLYAVWQHDESLKKGRYWICENREELERAVADWSSAWPILVQQFIHGNGEGVFGLATDGGIEAWSAHRRLRMMNPNGSGSSACISRSVPEDLLPKLERFVMQVGWRGLFMVELLRDDRGDLWFMEFNGRAWGSIALARRQGLEYPAWSVKQAIRSGDSHVIQTPKKTQVVCRHLGREIMHLLFLLRGPSSRAIRNWPRFWPTVAEMLHLRYGQFYYNWRKDDYKVFFIDTYFTILDQILKLKH